MPVPTTNINFNDIYRIPNNNTGLTPGANEPASSLFGKSYFDGPPGNNTISYYAWGVGTSDLIYGTTFNSYNWGNFAGLDYWYDNSTYNMTYKFANNGVNPSDDFDVRVYLMDNTSNVYTWADTGVVNVSPGSSTGTVTFSISGYAGTPLIKTNNFFIETQDVRGYAGSGNCDVYINGILTGTFPMLTGLNTFPCSSVGGPQDIGYNGVNGFDISLDMYP